MIRSPLAFRLNPQPARDLRDQLREAASLGAKGLVLDAAGDLNPDRLGETGRRELRHVLRTMELAPVALHLPTRRPFETDEQLDDRLARADGAFAMAYDLGFRLMLARVGRVPDESDAPRRETFAMALRELARRADRRGVRLAIEAGEQPGAVLSAFLDALAEPALAASLDPGAMLRFGHDPGESVVALGHHLAHAYATDTAGASAAPRRYGFRAGTLDWETYLGSLEEVDYRGSLTIWPDPNAPDQAGRFREMVALLRSF